MVTYICKRGCRKIKFKYVTKVAAIVNLRIWSNSLPVKHFSSILSNLASPCCASICLPVFQNEKRVKCLMFKKWWHKMFFSFRSREKLQSRVHQPRKCIHTILHKLEAWNQILRIDILFNPLLPFCFPRADILIVLRLLFDQWLTKNYFKHIHAEYWDT